ncbi:unnamed protein product [Oncorhynchus mykiss]|uniref:SEA domain-containing protein n=1 Tax=Oncorhynchus mykiss TaxID=8022 RepID=A0A060Y8Q3_ONCMY|nr:unnamed protein product [Oncorhynchus mykiss]
MPGTYTDIYTGTYTDIYTDAMNHQNSAYKFKTSNGAGMVSGNNHLSGGVAYRQQRSGPNPFQQQQPLNLSQVWRESQAQHHMVTERNGGHRHQQAYITPTIAAQAPYSFQHHNSPSHTANVHTHLAATHLAATHLPGQPHLYTYTATPAALGSTGTVAHLVATPGSARHTVQHTTYHTPGIVHQVPVSMGHHVLPSPTLHHSQYQAQFAHQTYISASPASTVYTGYPLSPTKKGYIEGDHTSNTCILQLVVSTGMHHKWIKCHDFHAMEGLRFSMGSLGISKTVLPIQGFGAAVLGLMLLVTMITAGSPAAVDWPPLDPTMLEEFQEEVPSWTESPSALLVSHTDASEHLDDTTTIALLSPGPLPLESPSRSSDPLSTPPFSSSEPEIVLQKHPEGPARLSRDMKLSGPISTMAATSSTLVTVPHQKLLGPQSNISTTPLNFSTATSGTTSPQFIVPNSNERASDEPPLLPPINQQDPSKQRTPALMTSLPVGPLNLPRLPVDNLADVAALSDQASPESRPNPDVSLSLGDLSLDHSEPSSRLIDLDHLRPSSELMQKDDAAQGIYMLLKPSPEMQLAPSYVPFLSPQTTSSSAEPTMVPTEDFFPTNTMEVDWGSGDHPETVTYMGSEGDDFSLVTNLPTDMYDLEDSNAERYDTSFPSRVGVSFSSMRHVTSSLSLTTTDLSSGVRSVAPTYVPPSIHPYPSHSMLASTLTPQGSLPEGSGVDWTDTFTVEPTDLLLPDMNSLEYYTIQLTKDDSEEHRGTNVTTTSRHFSLMSISTIHIMATSTLTEDPSHMLTASYGVEVQPSDNTTWIKESSDISGSEPLNTTTADATEMTSLNFSVSFLEPSLAPTPSMDLSSSLWGVTGQVFSGEWISPVATSSVGLDSSSVLVSVQPSAMASETDIQWYVSPTATETALLSTSVAFTPVPGQTELPPDVTSGPTERATNATTFPPVSVMADQGIDTDSPVTAVTNVSQSTLSTVDTPSTTDPATTTTTTTTITTKASTTTALATTTTTTTPLNITTTKSPPTTIGRQYLCNVSKPVYFVKVGFPPGATVGYAKSQIRDILKTEFNKSIELQVAKSPPDFVFRAVSGPVVFTAISVINALRQSGRRFQPISHYWKVPDHQYQVHSVLQFVPSHVDVRVCNFSERIEKGLTMAYAEVRRRAQESTNFTVHVSGDLLKTL